jgi:hypothetical protein
VSTGTELECMRSLAATAERIALALERLAGIQSPPRSEPVPQHLQPGVTGTPRVTPQQHSEPVRAPVPQRLAAQGLPPPARRAPVCNTEGPVYVGNNPVRCGLDAGHEGDHELAGFTWAPATPPPTEAPPPTEPGHELPTRTEPPPANLDDAGVP